MEEMIDVLDENGIKTGEVLTRKEVHKLGLWHKVVAIAIIDQQNKVLLQQRSFEKDTDAGKWDIAAAGHVSAGQHSKEAAIRETYEEIGFKIKEDDLEYLLTYNENFIFDNNDNIYNEIFDCYVVKIDKIDMNKIVLQESEVADAKLVTKEEFTEMVESGNMVDREAFYKTLIDYLDVSI